ncbi:MAG: ATP-dependent zinc metalloprotease FtsH [Lachnospiraceae bacterium]|nr:ATP-dependent zinc metalloprotease FtsH [Lachnospiraceae bacterium]
MERRTRFGGVFYFFLVAAIISMILMYSYAKNNTYSKNKYNIENFEKELEQQSDTKTKIKRIDLYPSNGTDAGKVMVSYSDGTARTFNVTNVAEAEKSIRGKDIVYTVHEVKNDSGSNTILIVVVIIVVVILVIMIMMMLGQSRSNGAGNSKLSNFGKSRATRIDPDDENAKKFEDVAGLKEEKEELEEVVDFLKDPEKYTEVGARIPKGLILVGPPGTGKTLLAKAVAGEAGVPFFSLSGSDFVEMFVGVGASRVRDMFAEAKNNAPCIIFIDEIDAVARKRGSGLGGGHDEREQTLNQLLVEMDGFSVNQGIIVMAATNRVDILDQAILRPGRFDRRVAVGRPDVKGREEILKVHCRNKPLADDVDLNRIAKTTVGFTGADLENLMNESAIACVAAGRKFITDEDISKSFIKVGIGTEKKSRVVSERDRKITAYHESGHAILFHLLPDVGPVHMVSIIPTGQGAAGYTMPIDEKDDMFLTKGKMLQEIQVDLGGRIAESLIFDDITTGASQDIINATDTARDMVTKYGFSELVGHINYADRDEVFVGRDYGKSSKGYSEEVAKEIDTEVKRIVDDCYKKAEKIIKDNIQILHKSADLLLEKERITREEFEALFAE